MLTYRLTRSQYLSKAFTGEGTKRAGGRWNYPGIPLIYTSSTLALALLETIVRLKAKYLPDGLIYFKVEMPDDIPMKKIEKKALPDAWANEIYDPYTQELGTKWAMSMTTAVLRVPSVISGEDYNYILNPQHKDYSLIKINKPVQISIDHRIKEMIGKSSL